MALNRESKILNQEQLQADIYSIQEEEVTPIEQGRRKTLSRIFYRYKIAIITTLLLLFLFMSLRHFGLIDDYFYTALILVVILPLIVNLALQLDSAISIATKVKTLPAKFDPGRLANRFEMIVNRIVKDKKVQKLVIIIDNLDRCSSGSTVGMLEAIKTLMEHEKCIYLISCSDDALIRNLELVRSYTRSDSAEFLRKFFHTSLTIPSLISQDLAKFAKDSLSSIEIEYSEQVLEVIVNAFIENPRRIKQFINSLTMQYIAAQEREKVGIFEPGEITNNDGFLAKILIIRQEYPHFYEELEYREDTLEDIEAYFRGSGGHPLYQSIKTVYEGTDTAKRTGVDVFTDCPGLEQFLKSTRLITVEDVSPFLKLNRETFPSTIPNAQEFKLQVNRGNVKYVMDDLDKLQQEDETIEYIRQIIRLIDSEIKAKHYDWAFNGIDILTKIYERTPPSIKQDVAATIGHYLTLREIGENLDKFDHNMVFTILRDMKKTHCDSVLENYALLLPDKNIDLTLIDKFNECCDLIQQKAIDNLNMRLISIYESNKEEAEKVVRRINSRPEASSRLISSELVSAVEGSIPASVTAVSDETRYVVDLYLELKQHSSVTTKASFLQKILARIAANSNPDYDDTKQFGVQTLMKLESKDISPGEVDGLYNTLNEYTGLMGQLTDKMEFIRLFYNFFGIFPDSQREGFMQTHLLPLIDSCSAGDLTQILTMAKVFKASILDYDFVLDKFINRVQTNVPDIAIIGLMIDNAPSKNKEKIKDLIVSLVNNPDAKYYVHGLESVKQFYTEFDDNQVGEMCDACLQRAINLGKPEKEKFINPILEAFGQCSSQFRRRFTDFTLDFICTDDPDIRKLGIDCYNGIKNYINRDQKEAIISQLLRFVEQRADQNAIDKNGEPILDLIIEEQDVLRRDDKVGIIDTLLSLRNEAKPKGIRLIGLKYLGKVNKFYHRKHLVIDTLQADLQSEDQDIRALAQETLESITVLAKQSTDSSTSS